MCFGRAQQPKTELCRNYVKLIRITIIIQFIITILNFISFNSFLKEGIFGIIFSFLLYAAQHHLSYQVVMIYIFISIFFAFRFLLYFLQPFQNKKTIGELSDYQKYTFIQSIISFAFYSFNAIFFYFPYKQFKTQAYGQNPALKKYFQRQMGQEDKNENETAKKVNYELNYGDIVVAARKNGDGGVFEVQKGKGIIVG